MIRANTRKAFEAWRAGKAAKPASSIWTDGIALYSYSTEIARKNDGHIAFNSQKYSVTTSRHQNGLMSLMGGLAFSKVQTFATQEEYQKHVNS